MPAYPKHKQLGRTIKEVGAHATTEPEAKLQEHCEGYLDYLKVPYIRIPDAIWSNRVPPHTRKQCARYLKGLPDLMIVDPADKYNRLLCVELKRKGGTATGGQKNWGRKMQMVIVRSLDDFQQVVDEFLNAND